MLATALGCTDADDTSFDINTISIVSGDDATAKFKVTAQNILTTGTVTDFETKSSYSLVVNVVDSGATPNTATVTVVVTVRPLIHIFI